MDDEELLAHALAYMRYVQAEDPDLHQEANGSPSVMEQITQRLTKEKHNV